MSDLQGLSAALGWRPGWRWIHDEIKLAAADQLHTIVEQEAEEIRLDVQMQTSVARPEFISDAPASAHMLQHKTIVMCRHFIREKPPFLRRDRQEDRERER